MRRIFLFFLLIPLAIFADLSEFFSEEKDPTVFHHVNVLSGHLNLSFQDAPLTGVHPIPIIRTYSSIGALQRSAKNEDLILKAHQGGWSIQNGWTLLPQTTFFLEFSPERKLCKAYVSEPNGNLLTYVYSHKKEGTKYTIFLKPSRTMSQSSGNLSKRSNPQYNLLEMDLEAGTAVLSLPNGGARIYRKASWSPSDKNASGTWFYLIYKELLPDQQQLCYFYDPEKNYLKRIESKNPAGQKVYAVVDIHYISQNKYRPSQLYFRTSEGTDLDYQMIRHENREYLSEVLSNHHLQEQFTFVPGRKGIGARLATLQIGGKEPFRVQYYLPDHIDQERKWAKDPTQKEFHIDKVKVISAPVGQSGEEIAVAQFLYYPERTDVRDAEGLLTRYHHDSNRLNLIEYFDEKDQLHSFQKFYWSATELQCKAFYNGEGQPLFAKTFVYEDGNVVEEVLWGYLTGNETQALQIDADGNPTGAESYRKTYTYYPNALLKTEIEEEGLTYEYVYKEGTDLCVSKLIRNSQGFILCREFSLYDDDHLLSCLIVDDGASTDLTDKRGITQRLEKRYERNSSSGLPEWISEIYWDPLLKTEKLLRKTKYTYLNQRVHTEEVLDAEGVSRYLLTTDYDNLGNVQRKTTPLGRENTYLYNAQGLLEASKEIGSHKKCFKYDPANRLEICEEPETGKILRTIYDAKQRILSQTDCRGNSTFHTYDCFGNRLATTLPQSTDEKEQLYHPTPKFTYDAQGNLTQAEMPQGEKTQTRYNLFRNPISILQADGTEIRHFYNKNGTLQRTLYADATEVHYAYDLFQRMTQKVIYSPDKKNLSSESWDYTPFQLRLHTDPRGLKTQFFYDGAGRKIVEEAEERRTTFAYDSLGFLEKTDNGFTALIQKHNVEGLVEEQWEEDIFGRIENRMQFFYDSENRKNKVIRFTSQGEAVDLIDYKEGKISCHTDPNGNSTRFIHNEFFENELGQKVLQKTTIDPLGNQTIETYDAGERLVLKEKKNPQGKPVFKEAVLYDRSGNQAKRISSIYRDTQWIRDISTEWKYDSMGRTIEEIESQRKITAYSYDFRGRLSSKTLPSGIHLSYQYDGADRLEELSSSDGKIHYRYTYERGPDPTQIVDLIQNLVLKFQYNRFGQIISETDGENSPRQWEYDAIGRCTRFTLPDGSSIHYPMQGAHIAAVQRKNNRGELLYEHCYRQFDPNGHIAEEDLIFNLGTLQTNHDLLERPSTQTSPYLNLSNSYGPSGLVCQTTNSLFGEKHYSYDSLNQLEQEGNQTYRFDSLGNPTACKVNDLNQIDTTSEYHLIYDPNGNPREKISATYTIQYQFDPLGRLIEITTPNQKRVLYSYDPLSRLYAKETYLYRSNSWQKQKKIYYLYDQEREIGIQDEEGHILELKVLGLGIRGDIGSAVAIEIEGILYAPLHDFNGNIIAIISSDGKIKEKYEIDAFGKESLSSQKNPWRFASKRSEEGLIFFGLRFYDPSLGRWLTPDPSGFADGANLYAYVQNSPLNRLDLFGLQSEKRFTPVEIYVPIPSIPRLPGLTTLLGHGKIDGIKVNFVISCGHWHQLQFTPEEIKMDRVNLLNHFHELTPTEGNQFGLVTVGNGIDTKLKDCFQMTEIVGKKVGNTLLMALYNPTEGPRLDIIRSMDELVGIETRNICAARQFMAAVGEKLYSVNQQSLWLCMPHSENGVITKRAIDGMTGAQQEILRKILHVFAVAPLHPLPNDHAASVANVYSEKDFITGFGLFGKVRLFVDNPNYDIRVLSCKSGRMDRNLWIADHGFLQPTYRKEWEAHIGRLKESYQFYGGLGHAKTR